MEVNSGISLTVPFPIAFPPVPGSRETPVWTGRNFKIGECDAAILSYEVGESGWSDELTTFHEETAGTDHYIDRASRRHTLDRLKRWVPADSPVLIDIGCSSGLMLEPLIDAFPTGTILGADYVRGPLEALARRHSGIPLLQFDLTSCPLPDASFDGIVLLNVLEHIEHHDAALSQVARILKPNGVVVIEVPSGPQLYDVYDKVLCHHRRYRMRELLALVRQAGLEILDRSHLGFFLYPAFWVTKKRGRRFLNASEAIQKSVVSRNITAAGSHWAMHALMALEARIRDHLYYPFGIRCLVTCRRAGKS